MKWYNIVSALALLLVALIAVNTALALPVTIDKVKFDGDEIYPSSMSTIRDFERGETVEVRVEVTAQADVENAQIEVELKGFDSSESIGDSTEVFDMETNRTYVKKLSLSFPNKLDMGKYKLRVRIEDADGETTYENYELDVDAAGHAMLIKDVIFSPSNYVQAGKSLLTTVRVQNVGSKDDSEGTRVEVAIPALGVSAVDYVDEINSDESESSEELWIVVPKCTKEGAYDVKVTVSYYDGEKTETKMYKINVMEDDSCEANAPATQPTAQKTVIAMGPTTMDVSAGQGGVIYPLTLTNAGSSAKTYVISVSGYEQWATVQVSPANTLVLQSGESQAVFVYLSAKETANAGRYPFTLTVSSGSESLKQFVLEANVVASAQKAPTTDYSALKTGLLVGIVVLVVILVILGLIVGFSRMKGKEEDNDEELSGQTYY